MGSVPPTQQERAANIKRLEGLGILDPACKTCQDEFYPSYREKGVGPFAPNHKASERCRSGKRAHCTCDTCF